MTVEPTSVDLLGPLSELPNWRVLASLVRASAIDATLARRADFASKHRLGNGPAIGPGHIPEGLTREDAHTPYGNVLDVLEGGAEKPEERALLGALLALSIEADPPSEPHLAEELGKHLVWLSAHTPCDALSALDTLGGPVRIELWSGVRQVVLEAQQDSSGLGMTEALVAAAALYRAQSPDVFNLRLEAYQQVTDPALAALLGAEGDFLPSDELSGELGAAPRSPWLTGLLALTSILFWISIGRLIARYALGFRRPAAVRLSARGVELVYRVQLLGRVLRDRRELIPVANLARVTREIRYSGASLYVGLIALTLGTYFGTGFFVDGVRVPGGSGALLGLAALFIVIGLGADFVLNSGADAIRGKSRLVVSPHVGRSFSLHAIDPSHADLLLKTLSDVTRATPSLKSDPEPTLRQEEPPQGSLA